MNKEQLIKILKDNEVYFNEALLNESIAGYSNDENAVYAKRLYNDLYLMATYGVQNGFKKVDDAIEKTSDLIAQLLNGSSYVMVNLSKMETQRQKILKSVGDLNGGINMDMKDELLKNLDDCIKVTDAIVSFRSDNENLCKRLTESKNLLLQIRAELDNVVDAQSKEAADYQSAIFDILMDWRSAVSGYNCYSDHVDQLKEAVEKAKEWGKLSASVKRFNRAQEKKHYYVYNPDYDDVSRIIKAAPYAERIDGLKESLADYRKGTTTIFNVERKKAQLQELEETLKSEKERLNGRLKELSDLFNAVKKQYQNGEINATSANQMCSAYNEEFTSCRDDLNRIEADYTMQITDLRKEIFDAGSDKRIRENVVREYETFLGKIENYRTTDPAMFVILCGRIDFKVLRDMLTGRASMQSREEMFTKIESITSVVENEINAQRKLGEELESIRKEQREERRVQEILDAKKREKNKVNSPNVIGLNNTLNSEAEDKKAMEAWMNMGGLGGIADFNKNSNDNTDGTIHVDNNDK